MEQRDFLQRQAEQFGQVLGKILCHLLGLKEQGEVKVDIKIANQAFNDELNFDIDSIVSIPTKKLAKNLKEEKGLSNENLETLAEILMLIAEDMSRDEKNRLYEKSLAIYEYLEVSENNTYSYNRNQKIEELKRNNT